MPGSQGIMPLLSPYGSLPFAETGTKSASHLLRAAQGSLALNAQSYFGRTLVCSPRNTTAHQNIIFLKPDFRGKNTYSSYYIKMTSPNFPV